MNTHFDIEQLIAAGAITNELDLERAMIADRKLRLLAKENEHFKNLRGQLRALIEAYEYTVWNDVSIVAEAQMTDSYRSESQAEKERIFIEGRSAKIQGRLKELDLTEENLSALLGYPSKAYMSELMDGIKPFTLKDLIIINQLLGVAIGDLVPPFLSTEDQEQIRASVEALNKPWIKLEEDSITLKRI